MSVSSSIPLESALACLDVEVMKRDEQTKLVPQSVAKHQTNANADTSEVKEYMGQARIE